MCFKGFLFDIKKIFELFLPKQFWRYYDSYCRISRRKGSRKKKSSSTSGRATKALPPPLELSGHRNFFFKIFF